MAKQTETDIVIAGLGPAGMILALLLKGSGLAITALDRQHPETGLDNKADIRTTALSYGTQKVLQHIGVWDKLAFHACPIKRIDILDDDSPVLLDFNAHEVGDNPFGWIIENRIFKSILWEEIQNIERCSIDVPAQITGLSLEDNHAVLNSVQNDYQAKLVIAADGRNSALREPAGIATRGWSYNQTALVCTVAHEFPHDHVAVEHFRPEGPFAILPMLDDDEGRHRSSVVWTDHNGTLDKNGLTKRDIELGLQARFPDIYGRIELIGPHAFYPLSLTHAYELTAQRFALVADAAHGIHPIAGQGLNLGIRDVAELATLINVAVANGEDIGHQDLLRNYAAKRRMDNMAMVAVTDGFNKMFAQRFTPFKRARQMGMKAVAHFPPAKQFFMKQAMGAAGFLPAIIKDRG